MMRLLVIHAHPDDETITTGGTIAWYTARGVDVTVLTCSLGEEGEVIGEQWSQLVADQSDQLGGYRIHELDAALTALGVRAPRFLGGAGRYRDSGMLGTPASLHPRAFVNADRDEAIETMVAVIRSARPHVVIGYDPQGGYGHPDHMQVHALVTAAVDVAGDDGYSDAGAPWDPPKYYWTVTGRAQLRQALDAVTAVAPPWRMPHAGELPSVAEELITTSIDIRAVFDAKVDALRAHATQVTVAASGTEYVLSNGVVQPIFADEQFVLVRGSVGELGESGRETDLFSGVVDVG